MELDIIINKSCLVGLADIPDQSVNCCVTSPPYYGLRDYGHDDQIGLEATPEEYVANLVSVFREVKRVLRDDGTLWLNLGDSYAGGKLGRDDMDEAGRKRLSEFGHSGVGKKDQSPINKTTQRKPPTGLKEKDLIGIPWMVAFALRADGWYLRQDIIWSKPNPMPESVKDRCTKSHEYIFLLSKSKKYFFDYEAIQEEATGYDGRNDTKMKGSVKYANGHTPSGEANTMSVKGHERWKYKNLGDKGLQTHSFHERRAEGLQDEMSPIRNKRSVWTVAPKPFSGAHFAVFPPELIVDCIRAGCPGGG